MVTVRLRQRRERLVRSRSGAPSSLRLAPGQHYGVAAIQPEGRWIRLLAAASVNDQSLG